VVDRDPGRVSYVVDRSEDNVAAGMVATDAYWLSDIVLADDAALGTLDAVADGRRGTVTESAPSAGVLLGGLLPAMPYVVRGMAQTGEERLVGSDQLTLELGNVTSLTVDLARAGLSCDADLDVTTDVEVHIELVGCDRTVVTTPGQ
jgi:hypothetical protein